MVLGMPIYPILLVNQPLKARMLKLSLSELNLQYSSAFINFIPFLREIKNNMADLNQTAS